MGRRENEHLVLELLKDELLLIGIGTAGWVAVGLWLGSSGDNRTSEWSAFIGDRGQGSSEDGENGEEASELHYD